MHPVRARRHFLGKETDGGHDGFVTFIRFGNGPGRRG